MKTAKAWKTVIVAAVAALSIAGCGQIPGNHQSKLNIQEESSHLEQWQKELKQSTQSGGVYSGAVRGIRVQKGGKVVFSASYEPKEYKETFDY